MDNYGSINILVEAKKEYTSELVSILIPKIYEKIRYIYTVLKNNLKGNVYFEFQNELRKISEWSESRVTKETNNILDNLNCDWFPDLLTAVFVSNTRILTFIQMSKNKNVNKIKLEIPSNNKFIHYCYIECAREFYKNPYLFETISLQSSEIHRNLRESLNIIKESITKSIRKLLPFQQILHKYLGKPIDSFNEHLESNVKERPKSKLFNRLMRNSISNSDQLLSDSENDINSDSDNESNNSESNNKLEKDTNVNDTSDSENDDNKSNYDEPIFNNNKSINNEVFDNEPSNNEPINNEVVHNEVVNNQVVDNEVVDNEVVHNEVVHNEVVDNEVAENEVLDNEVVDNEVAENEVVGNQVVDNEVVDNEVVGNEVVDNEVVDNEVAENEVVGNQVVDNEVDENEVVGNQVVDNVVVGNQVVDNEVVGNQVVDNEVVGNQVVDNEVVDNEVVENKVITSNEQLNNVLVDNTNIQYKQVSNEENNTKLIINKTDNNVNVENTVSNTNEDYKNQNNNDLIFKEKNIINNLIDEGLSKPKLNKNDMYYLDNIYNNKYIKKIPRKLVKRRKQKVSNNKNIQNTLFDDAGDISE